MKSNVSGIGAVRFQCKTCAQAVTYDIGLCDQRHRDCFNNVVILGNDTDDVYELLTTRFRVNSYGPIPVSFMTKSNADLGKLTVIEYDHVNEGRYRIDGEVVENTVVITSDRRLDDTRYERSEKWLNDSRKINQIIDSNGFNHVPSSYPDFYLEKWNEQFNELLKLDPNIGDFDHGSIQFGNRWSATLAHTKNSFTVYTLGNLTERHEVQLLAVLSYLIVVANNELGSCTIIVPRWLIDGVHYNVRQYFVETMFNTCCQTIVFSNDYSLKDVCNHVFEKRVRNIKDENSYQYHAEIELQQIR